MERDTIYKDNAVGLDEPKKTGAAIAVERLPNTHESLPTLTDVLAVVGLRRRIR